MALMNSHSWGLKREKVRIIYLPSKMMLHIHAKRAVTEQVQNRFYLTVTPRVASIHRQSSGHQTLINPKTKMHTLPYEYLNSRQRFQLPNPLPIKRSIPYSICSKQISTFQIKNPFGRMLPGQLVFNSSRKRNWSGHNVSKNLI